MSVQEDLRKARNRPNDVLAAILEDHAEIKERFQAVDDAPDGYERDKAFGLLMRKLVVHETAEQEIVHPLLPASNSAVVDEHLDQEKSATNLLSELESMGVDGDGFHDTFEELRSAVLEHAESEEENEFPLIERHVEQSELDRMASQFRTAEAAAPTHPHPHSPTSASGNMVVGPAAAIADRVRDAIRSSRGDSAER